MKRLSTIILILVGLYIVNHYPERSIAKPHQCLWDGCPYQGHTEFFSDCEEGTDGYYFQLTHFQHPELTPDQCEDFIFDNGIENTKSL